jgi:hypothetical protein
MALGATRSVSSMDLSGDRGAQQAQHRKGGGP